MLGKALWEIGPFKDVAESRAAFRQLQDREYIRYANLPLETKTAQTRQVEFVSNLYMVAGKRVIQCNVRDITERSHVSAELRRDNEELLTVVATLQQRDREMQLLNRMIDLLQRCTAEEEAYGVIERMAPSSSPDRAGISRVRAPRTRLSRPSRAGETTRRPWLSSRWKTALRCNGVGLTRSSIRGRARSAAISVTSRAGPLFASP
jgi:hypothetical protein